MKLIDKILNIPLYKKHYLIVYITRGITLGQIEISITKRIRSMFINDLQNEIFNIRKFISEENTKTNDVAILNAIKTGMTFKFRGK